MSKKSKTAKQKGIDNRAEQLNPLSEKFLKSREENLTQKDVALIQKAEQKANDKQKKGGVGAKAQKKLAERR